MINIVSPFEQQNSNRHTKSLPSALMIYKDGGMLVNVRMVVVINGRDYQLYDINECCGYGFTLKIDIVFFAHFLNHFSGFV